MATSGTLRLTIIEAELTRDTEMFGAMDPYVQICQRMQMFRTKTQDDAGKTPKWNETFDLDVKYVGDELFIKVKDENVTDSDDIGEAIVKLSAFCVQGGIDDWWQISYGGRKAGSLHLKGEWFPKGSDPIAASAAQAPGL